MSLPKKLEEFWNYYFIELDQENQHDIYDLCEGFYTLFKNDWERWSKRTIGKVELIFEEQFGSFFEECYIQLKKFTLTVFSEDAYSTKVLKIWKNVNNEKSRLLEIKNHYDILNDFSKIKAESNKWMKKVSGGKDFNKQAFNRMQQSYYETTFSSEYYDNLVANGQLDGLFEVYDDDDSGYLEIDEIYEVVKDIHKEMINELKSIAYQKIQNPRGLEEAWRLQWDLKFKNKNSIDKKHFVSLYKDFISYQSIQELDPKMNYFIGQEFQKIIEDISKSDNKLSLNFQQLKPAFLNFNHFTKRNTALNQTMSRKTLYKSQEERLNLAWLLQLQLEEKQIDLNTRYYKTVVQKKGQLSKKNFFPLVKNIYKQKFTINEYKMAFKKIKEIYFRHDYNQNKKLEYNDLKTVYKELIVLMQVKVHNINYQKIKDQPNLIMKGWQHIRRLLNYDNKISKKIFCKLGDTFMELYTTVDFKLKKNKVKLSKMFDEVADRKGSKLTLKQLQKKCLEFSDYVFREDQSQSGGDIRSNEDQSRAQTSRNLSTKDDSMRNSMFPGKSLNPVVKTITTSRRGMRNSANLITESGSPIRRNKAEKLLFNPINLVKECTKLLKQYSSNGDQLNYLETIAAMKYVFKNHGNDYDLSRCNDYIRNGYFAEDYGDFDSQIFNKKLDFQEFYQLVTKNLEKFTTKKSDGKVLNQATLLKRSNDLIKRFAKVNDDSLNYFETLNAMKQVFKHYGKDHNHEKFTNYIRSGQFSRDFDTVDVNFDEDLDLVELQKLVEMVINKRIRHHQ